MHSDELYEHTLSRLHRQIVDAYNLEELKGLCLALNVRYEDLDGNTLSARSWALLESVQRHHIFEHLLVQLKQDRPNIEWDNFLPTQQNAKPPFKGLQSFNEADEHLFFGRESLTAELVAHLCGHRFLAIVGASGSGKSSVVRAGVVPSIRRGEVEFNSQHSNTWPVYTITPTTHPLRELATVITSNAQPISATAKLIDDFAKDARSLDLAVTRMLHHQRYDKKQKKYKKTGRLVLVVDQFEELFTACKDETERQSFIDNLFYAISPEVDGATTLIITLRADFYEHCSRYPSLRQALADFQVYIGSMTNSELYQAITKPLENSPWEYQAGLVDTILQDIGSTEGRSPEPGSLPLLSHVLLETWKRREGHTLTLAGYQNAGGVYKAIAHTADEVYRQLTPEKQSIALDIFLRLSELGEGTQDTRRRSTIREMTSNQGSSEKVRQVLNHLADARLIVVDKDIVEVAHEALIREWPRLRLWLDENRESLRFYRQLAVDAQAWQSDNRDESYLYRGTRLLQAQEWCSDYDDESLNTIEKEFLARSIAQREQEVRLTRWRTIGVVAILSLLLSGSIIATFIFQQQARESERQSQIFQIQSIASLAPRVVDRTNDTELATLLAVEAWHLNQKYSGLQQELVDSSLRDILSFPFFNTTAISKIGEESYIMGRALPESAHYNDLAFSPDGNIFASSSRNENILLWNVDDLSAPYAILTSEGSQFLSIAFSPDGKTLASSSKEANVSSTKLWDLTNLENRPIIVSVYDSPALSLTYSPDGQFLAEGRYDETVHIWNLASLDSEPLIFRSNEHETAGEFRSVDFSPDGRFLAAGSWDWLIRVWDLDAPGNDPVIISHGGHVSSVAFSLDGRFLASANSELFGDLGGVVLLWSTDDYRGSPVRLEGHAGSINDLAFSPDGNTLASASSDRTIRLWDLNSLGADPMILNGHQEGVTSIAYAPDGKAIISTDNESTLKLWNLDAQNANPTLFSSYENPLLSIASGGNGAIVSISSASFLAENSLLRIWNTQNPQESPILLSLSGKSINEIRSDGQILATASWSQGPGPPFSILNLWTLTDLESPYSTIRLSDLPTNSNVSNNWQTTNLAFSNDGQTLATAHLDGNIYLWKSSGFDIEPVILPNQGTWLTSLAFSPKDDYLIVAKNRSVIEDEGVNEKAIIRLIDLTSSKYDSQEFEFPNGVRAITSRYSRNQLVGALDDGSIWLWDLNDPQRIPTKWLDLEPQITAMAYSPDEKFFAVGEEDGLIRLWNLEAMSADPIVLGGHVSRIRLLKFRQDGQILISGSDDRTVRLWPAPPALLELACEKVQRNMSWEEWQEYFPGEAYRRTCSNLPFHPSVRNNS